MADKSEIRHAISAQSIHDNLVKCQLALTLTRIEYRLVANESSEFGYESSEFGWVQNDHGYESTRF